MRALVLTHSVAAQAQVGGAAPAGAAGTDDDVPVAATSPRAPARRTGSPGWARSRRRWGWVPARTWLGPVSDGAATLTGCVPARCRWVPAQMGRRGLSPRTTAAGTQGPGPWSLSELTAPPSGSAWLQKQTRCSLSRFRGRESGLLKRTAFAFRLRHFRTHGGLCEFCAFWSEMADTDGRQLRRQCRVCRVCRVWRLAILQPTASDVRRVSRARHTNHICLMMTVQHSGSRTRRMHALRHGSKHKAAAATEEGRDTYHEDDIVAVTNSSARRLRAFCDLDDKPPTVAHQRHAACRRPRVVPFETVAIRWRSRGRRWCGHCHGRDGFA